MDDEDNSTRWQDWRNLILGALLVFSPLFIQYPIDMPYAWLNLTIVGFALIALSALAIYEPNVWEEGLNLLIGIWLMAAPWVLKFQNEDQVMLISVGVGALALLLSTWAIWRDKNVVEWRHLT